MTLKPITSRRSLLSQLDRLDSRVLGAGLAAVGAGGAMLAAPESADASIVWSGVVNIAIPGNIDGVYLVVDTGVSGPTGGATPGWDINPYFGANTFYNAAPGYGAVASGANAANLAMNTVIDGTNATTTTSLSGSLFPTSSPGGLYGFRFQESTASLIRYGWARIIRGASTSTAGTIVEYAWENTGAGIPAGVPEPGSLALLAMGAVGVLVRRRK